MDRIEVEQLHSIIKDCLFKDEEIVDGKPVIEPVKVKGITANFGFHPERLKAHTNEIAAMLRLLPKQFRKGEGDGWSFLNACVDINGNQWTGMHRDMEELIVLGIAIGKAGFCMPREMWAIMPGGVPYFWVE